MGKLLGWLSEAYFKVKSDAGTERSVFDKDGNLYQGGTVITATATALNTATAALANRAVTTGIDGSTGKKACAVNGLTIVTGGTGIADLSLAAPTAGARAVIRIGTLSSGNVVVKTATGVTFDGTNNTATFDAANEALVLVYASATAWAVELNVGAVALSST